MHRITSLTAVVLLSACGGSRPPPVAEQRSPPLTAVPSADLAPPPREDGRLPPGARPTRYALDLTIDPAQKTFAGHTRIGVKLAEPARAIVMHGRDLTMRTVVADTPRGKITGRARSRLAFGATEGPDELVLEFDEELPQGEAELDLGYDASFTEQLRGLFRVEEEGTPYAFTNFEPSDARRMFPCFDEPTFKTPFQVTLRVPKGNLAFANASETKRTEDAATGLTTFEFAPSRPLATYLVAVAVGPLEVLEGPKTPVPIRVITAKGKASLGKIGLETAVAHLDLLTKYFDQPYPYGKLDLVAVPNFEGGAMENAGLITFREELLLVDGKSASVGARRAQADTLGHELAHQWFGNLVTMQWWDDVWLKESFAQWTAAKIVDQWKPESKAKLQQASQKSWAMLQDALPAARQVRNPARTAKEVTDSYNPLIFFKGAPLIGMLETWLGADTFRDGVRRYMKKHRDGSVTSTDLYAALGEASGREVGRVVDSFIGQSGVPVVSAELDCSFAEGAEAKGGAAVPFLRLRQEEYRYLDRKGPAPKQWRVPVCVRYDATGELATQCTLLDGPAGRIDLAPPPGRSAKCPAFFYPNAGEVGYYRFRLTRTDLDKLARGGLAKLAESERLGLLINAWGAVWSGHLAMSAYFEILSAYKNETSQLVLEQVLDTLLEAEKAVVTDASRSAFARLVRELLGPAARRLGWTAKEGEPEEAKLTRSAMLFAMGHAGQDPAVLAEAARVTNVWLGDPAKGDRELVNVALLLATKKNEVATFDRLVTLLKGPMTPEIRQSVRLGLTGFDAPALVERTLGFTLDGTLKAQDTVNVLFALVRRKKTMETTLAWVEKHFAEISKASANAPEALAYAPRALCNAERVRAVEALLAPRIDKLGQAAAQLKENVDGALRCAALAEKETEPTSAWLAARGKGH